MPLAEPDGECLGGMIQESRFTVCTRGRLSAIHLENNYEMIENNYEMILKPLSL